MNPNQKTVNSDFNPWQRKINYYAAKELKIRPSLDDLEFITSRKRWGLHLMSGFMKINKIDFGHIAEKMLTHKQLDEACYYF